MHAGAWSGGPVKRSFLFAILVFAFSGTVCGETLTVSSLADNNGAGELRAAITSANANPGSTIIFKSGLTGVIKLSSGLPTITASMTIEGPGASPLAIDGMG